MREKYFLLKENDTDDRDCVKYLEFDNENEFRFGICGACFYNISKEDEQQLLNNYENLTTALTKEELTQLFKIDNTWHNDRTTDNATTLYNIKKKLESDLNKDLFMQVQEEEIEWLYNEYSLDYNDIEEIFDNYGLEYRDRAVVDYVWTDTYELGENYICECCNVENWLECYIDYEKFGRDMVDNDGERYVELTDGRIVELSY